MVQPLRGRLWQVFLCLEGKREAGLYDQLVQKALGNTKYGRKVRLCNDWGCVVTFSSTCMLYLLLCRCLCISSIVAGQLE